GRQPAGRDDDTRARDDPAAEPGPRPGASARSARRRARSPARARGDLRGVLAAMSYPDVAGLAVALDGAALRVTLDRPDRRNAIDAVVMKGLVDTFTAAATDGRVRVVVLTGRGEHFCGGADIVARNAPGDAPKPRVGAIQRRLPTQAHHLIALVCEIQVPVVCKVRGVAAGIGFSLALAADFTIAAADARFWEPFAQRGFTADSGA